jgi:hypothetical protein
MTTQAPILTADVLDSRGKYFEWPYNLNSNTSTSAEKQPDGTIAVNQFDYPSRVALEELRAKITPGIPPSAGQIRLQAVRPRFLRCLSISNPAMGAKF